MFLACPAGSSERTLGEHLNGTPEILFEPQTNAKGSCSKNDRSTDGLYGPVCAWNDAKMMDDRVPAIDALPMLAKMRLSLPMFRWIYLRWIEDA